MTNQTTNLSGGPRTEAGKFESSKNAIKHGLTMQSIDRFPAHLRAEFESFLAQQYEEHKPVTCNECDYLEQYAFQRFQLSRALPMLMQLQDDLSQDPHNEALEKHFQRPPRQARMTRMRSLLYCIQFANMRLERNQSARPETANPQA